MSHYFSTRRVAEVLDFSEKHIRELCRRGVLPSVRVGNRYRVPFGALAEYLRDNRVAAFVGEGCEGVR